MCSRMASSADSSGISLTQGLHHVAQKFTTTHLPRCWTRSYGVPSIMASCSVGNSASIVSGGLVGSVAGVASVAGAVSGSATGAGCAVCCCFGVSAVGLHAASTSANGNDSRAASCRRIGSVLVIGIDGGNAALEKFAQRYAQLVDGGDCGVAERIVAAWQVRFGDRD